MGNKNVPELYLNKINLTVSNTDGSYLNEVSQTTSNMAGESLNVQSPGDGPEAVLNMLR